MIKIEILNKGKLVAVALVSKLDWHQRYKLIDYVDLADEASTTHEGARLFLKDRAAGRFNQQKAR